ncbi:MAG: GNAT family N-acetyltransferase [Tannerellaceae bacterium]|jgi:GNAT superfamily N-acetyltransferase|nr:GNAT family N-acetyltransferase [Tannerellaceae bacterium]
MVTITEVISRKELREFVKFNIRLYKDNPWHVPALISEEMITLDINKNPAFEHCHAAFFLAHRQGITVGRIAVIVNRHSNTIWKQRYARFGWLDFIDDKEVVDKLFETAEIWALGQGMHSLIGPMGFTDLDHEGMLVTGFDRLATMATIYNHPYYPQHLERMGYVKEIDWHEFKIFIPDAIPEKHLRIGEIVKERYQLEVLKCRSTKELMKYAHQVFELLNIAYAPLYGYAPLTENQIEYYLAIYLPMLRLDLVTLILRKADRRLIGFGISLPSLSKAMKQARGRFFPLGWFYLLRTLKTRPQVIDLYLIAIHPEYQNKGVNALLFNDLIPIYRKLGVLYAESNPELETNTSVQSQWTYFRREHHKTRRLYRKDFSA